MRRYLALIRLELTLTARNAAVIVFNYIFPLVIFFVGAMILKVENDPVAAGEMVARSLVFMVLGNGLYGAGMRLVQDREAGILRRYKIAPITPLPLMTASIVTGWAVGMPLLVLLLACGRLFYRMPLPANPLPLVLLFLAGVAAFRALGLIVAAVANNTQESNALIQLIFFPSFLLGGVAIPIGKFPPAMQLASRLFPAAPLYDGLRASLTGSAVPLLPALALMALVIATGLHTASRLFRWDPEQKIPGRDKLWLLAGLAPFFLLGLIRHFAPGLFPSP